MQEKNEKEINEAKKELIDLYLILKPRKVEDVKKNFNKYYLIKIFYLSQSENITEEEKDKDNEEECNELFNKSIKDLIEYIKVSIDIIVTLKVDEELKKYTKDNPNSANEYETLLQKEEEAIRQHISTEHQLKIQCEKYAEKIDIMENEKLFLINEIVRNI